MTLIQELKNLFSSQKGLYEVKFNENYDDYESNADILIFAEFNCNVYRHPVGWTECGKCHCHYSCNTSKEFEDLISKYGYEMEWENCCIAGLYVKYLK
jgi:hypothetical protein